MDPSGPIARRFPLIARPRPACTALASRIDELVALAARAVRTDDQTCASRVHNQAALIASDCGQPELARAWCHRHATAYLRQRQPFDAPTARLALEPLVNLARLDIRAGKGKAGYQIIGKLLHAVSHRIDIDIEHIQLPMSQLMPTNQDQRELRTWLWSVHLADGTRALTSTGRWTDAEEHLRHHHGIGDRMLDGRQVAIISRTITGDHAGARRLLTETAQGDPWEAAVTACLRLYCRPSDADRETTSDLVPHHVAMESGPAMVVFRTRWALSVVAATGPDHPEIDELMRRATREVVAAEDGYAARDLLADRQWALNISEHQQHDLARIVAVSGLDQSIPEPLVPRLEKALASCEAVITRRPP